MVNILYTEHQGNNNNISKRKAFDQLFTTMVAGWYYVRLKLFDQQVTKNLSKHTRQYCIMNHEHCITINASQKQNTHSQQTKLSAAPRKNSLTMSNVCGNKNTSSSSNMPQNRKKTGNISIMSNNVFEGSLETKVP